MGTSLEERVSELEALNCALSLEVSAIKEQGVMIECSIIRSQRWKLFNCILCATAFIVSLVVDANIPEASAVMDVLVVSTLVLFLYSGYSFAFAEVEQ